MRRLGWIEKAFLLFAAVYALLYFTRVAPTIEWLAALGVFILALVALIKLAQAHDALQCRLVAQVAAQGVGRVGRIGNDAAIANNIDRLLDEAGLRIIGMDIEILAHEAPCHSVQTGVQPAGSAGKRPSSIQGI